MSNATKSSYKKYKKLPLPRNFTEEQIPNFQITTELLNTAENHKVLHDLFSSLYKCFHKVTISGPFGGSPDPKQSVDSNRYTIIIVESKNPKTMEPWYDIWRINKKLGSDFMYMTNNLSSWMWSKMYLSRSIRILKYWLNEIIYNKQAKILGQFVNEMKTISEKSFYTNMAYGLLLNDSYIRYFVKDLPDPLTCLT
jgi:hypothetical protein